MLGEVLRIEALAAPVTQTPLGAVLFVQVHALQRKELGAKPARPEQRA